MAWLRPFLLLGAVIAGIAVTALPRGNAQPSPTFWSQALWIAESTGLLKVDSQSGAILFEVNDARNGRTLAIDDSRAIVWQYGPGNVLARYDFDGVFQSAIAVSEDSSPDLILDQDDLSLYDEDVPLGLEEAYTEHVGMVVKPGSGYAFLAVDQLLVAYDPDLIRQAHYSLPYPFVGGTIDPPSQEIWIGTEEAIVLIDGSGGYHQYDFPASSIRDVAVDPVSRELWVVFSDRLVRYTVLDRSFTEQVSVPIPDVLRIESDHRGGLWAATAQSAIRLDPAGNVLFEIAVFDSLLAVRALAVDQSYRSGWVGSRLSVESYLPDGSPLHVIEITPSLVRAIAHYGLPDLTPPTIAFTSPEDGSLVTTAFPSITIAYDDVGEGLDPSTLQVDGDGLFPPLTCVAQAFAATCTTGSVPVPNGLHVLTATISDRPGNVSSATVSFRVYVPTTIAPPDGAKLEAGLSGGTATVTGGPGSVPGGATVRVTNLRTGESVTVVAGADGSFSASLGGSRLDEFAVVVLEGSAQSEAVLVGIPPVDPSLVASPIDPTVPTDFASSVAFLVSGPSPVQSGVALGALDAEKLAVLRGSVRDLSGAPLAGVRVHIANHPEYGRTYTRADGSGAFDLVVNGGPLVLQFERAGYLGAQRRIDVPWDDYFQVMDVRLVAVDPVVTAVDLGASAPPQVARGSVVTDADGTRQATLIFPSGDMSAEMVFPGGQTQPMGATSGFRATEYSVGEGGPDTMPGPLPGVSAYTYCVDLSFDEARWAGALGVRFNQPVSFYLENFLAFPVGAPVPLGYYDAQTSVAAWIPSPNGRIVEVASITGGRADLIVNEAGTVATAEELAELGIMDEEREQLASLYTAGTTLWRMRLTHFSSWDPNGPSYYIPDAISPKQRIQEPRDCQDTASGSIIGCQNQTLGERVGPLAGTGVSLVYSSERTEGRKAVLDVPLIGDVVPQAMAGIDLTIEVAGQFHSWHFAPAANLAHRFEWDGNDGYGREVQGSWPAKIRIGYVYDTKYARPVDANAYSQFQSFGLASDMPLISYESIPARDTYTFWQEIHQPIHRWVAKPLGLGGWTLDVHHAFDVSGQTLFLGDGTRRSDVHTDFQLAAGRYPGNREADSLWSPQGIDVDEQLRTYVADEARTIVARVDRGGEFSLIAGVSDVWGFAGDGGPASEALLSGPLSVAVTPDGGVVYIADSYNERIRRVDRAGIITTIAGTGAAGHAGDGGPAIGATLSNPRGLKLADDGNLYFVQGSWAASDPGLVRRITPDGTIQRIAGGGTVDPPETNEGRPALEAELGYLHDVEVAPDGTIYIADYCKVYRVDPTGVIQTFAGNGSCGADGDGGPAVDAELWWAKGVARARDGSLYIGDHRFIRRVGPDGVITTIPSGPAVRTAFDGYPEYSCGDWWGTGVADVTFGADGSLYFVDGNCAMATKIGQPAIDPTAANERVIPAADGREMYVFSAEGRHLRTLDGLTGSLRLTFRYDGAGRLARVEDADGNVLSIERNGTGNPAAIVAPGGQRTTLATGAGGYLSSITNPAGEGPGMTYGAGGLLATFTSPRGHQSVFTYDADGRLLTDEDPVGGSQTLSRSVSNARSDVSRTTAMGRTTTYRTDYVEEGVQTVKVLPDGTRETTNIDEPQGITTTSLPGGTRIEVESGREPRFGTLEPFVRRVLVQTTGGRALEVLRARSVETEPEDPLALVSQTDTVTVNDRVWRTEFVASSRTVTTSSPEGRQAVTTLDARGRPLRVVVGNLAPVELAYDSRGRVERVTAGTGADSRVSAFAWDTANRLLSATDPMGRVVSFGYDAADRVTSQQFPGNRTVSAAYDDAGNVTSLTPPGKPAHELSYTPVDLESRYTPPPVSGSGNNVTDYAYNADRQLTQMTRPDLATVVPAYDVTKGRLTSLTHAAGTITPGYSATTGRITSLSESNGENLVFEWDGFLPIEETWSGPVAGAITRTFDDDFRLVTESVNGGSNVSFSYDRDGLLTAAGALALERNSTNGLLAGTTLGSVSTRRTHNSFAEPIFDAASVSGPDVFRVEYTRDALGRITSRTETIGGTTAVWEYGYDAAGRLETVTKDGVVQRSYAFDANGNRTSKTEGAAVEECAHDDQDRLLSCGPLGGPATVSFVYTSNGELAAKADAGGTTGFAYDALGNLRSATLPSGDAIDYVIDGRNRRVGKKVNGVKVEAFLYRDQLEPVAWLDSAGNVVARFVYGSKAHVPDYMAKGGATYRIVSDHLGSPRLVINTATGAIAQRMDFDEWGNVTLDTAPGFQPFGFAGGIYDRDTGLTRFGARDYDPRVGRWTAKDPIRFGGGLNLYRYAAADPVNFVDVTGRDPATATAVGAAAASGIPGVIPVAAPAAELTLAGGGTAAGAGGAVLLPAAAVTGAALVGVGLGLLANEVIDYLFWDPYYAQFEPSQECMPRGDIKDFERVIRDWERRTGQKIDKDMRRRIHDELQREKGGRLNVPPGEITEIIDGLFPPLTTNTAGPGMD